MRRHRSNSKVTLLSSLEVAIPDLGTNRSNRIDGSGSLTLAFATDALPPQADLTRLSNLQPALPTSQLHSYLLKNV